MGDFGKRFTMTRFTGGTTEAQRSQRPRVTQGSGGDRTHQAVGKGELWQVLIWKRIPGKAQEKPDDWEERGVRLPNSPAERQP